MQDDVKQLRHLWLQLHEWHVAQAPDRYQPASEAAFDAWYAWAVKEHTILTERIAGVVRGYATVRVVSSPGNALVRQRRYAYLDHVIVDRDLRGEGLGQRLIDQASTFARDHGCAHLELDCRRDNPAHGFFAVLGFLPVSERLSLVLDEPRAVAP